MRNIPIAILLIFTVLAVSCEETGEKSSGKHAGKLNSKLDTVSYLFGYSTGQQWKQSGLQDIDMNIFIGAMNEAFDGEEIKVDMIKGGEIVRSYMQEQRDAMASENLKASENYLALNKDKEGVITTESGLQYKVIEEGDGPTPKLNDKVKVHYHGTTTDDVVFDSSVDRGQPAEFIVGQLIKGLNEGLQLMPVGSKYQFFIHPEIGYGENGTPNIEPNSVLLFDIELIEILEEKPSEE